MLDYLNKQSMQETKKKKDQTAPTNHKEDDPNPKLYPQESKHRFSNFQIRSNSKIEEIESEISEKNFGQHSSKKQYRKSSLKFHQNQSKKRNSVTNFQQMYKSKEDSLLNMDSHLSSKNSQYLLFGKSINKSGFKLNVTKRINKKVLKKILRKIIVIGFLSIVIYLELFHYTNFTNKEMKFLSEVFENGQKYKHNFGFDIFEFLTNIGFFFPFLGFICILFLYHTEKVNLHLMICNFFLYSFVGVLFCMIFEGDRPFWRMDIQEIQPRLCKRNFANPDPFLFNFFGLQYYVMTLLNKLKFSRVMIVLLWVLSSLLNLLFFLFFYIDGQIFLTEFLLMPGLAFAAIYFLKLFKKPLEDIFEGLSVKKSKNKIKRFYFLIILLLVLFMIQNIYRSQMKEDSGTQKIANVIECYSFIKGYGPTSIVRPNKSVNRIVGLYPTMFFSQGIVSVLGMLLGLFVAHFFIKDNRFWFKNSKKIFVFRILSCLIVIILSIGKSLAFKYLAF